MMQLVNAYLALRRAAGFKLESTEWRLRSFARFGGALGDTHIRVETGIAWSAKAISPRERHARLTDLIKFARHCASEDPVHEVPSSHIYAFKQQRRLPHIYTPNEIHTLLLSAGQLGPKGSSRADTFQTLFGLLASTGLRIQEALNLRLNDLNADGLTIRDTKFRKSRLVPLHETTRRKLLAYCECWRSKALMDDPVFISIKATALGYDSVNATFLKRRAVYKAIARAQRAEMAL